MFLVLGDAFEQAIFHANVLWNDTVYLVVGLITQTVENCPFRRIDGITEKVVEENDGSFGRISVGQATRGRVLGTAEQAPRREDAAAERAARVRARILITGSLASDLESLAGA